jgi:hypothetical protein
MALSQQDSGIAQTLFLSPFIQRKIDAIYFYRSLFSDFRL